MPERILIVVAGPTAVGKTSIAVRLAQYFNTEVLSADSRQIYKEMSIGTAKPDASEMQGVIHHFVDSHSISEDFNAGVFERESLQLLDNLFQKHKVVILAGGTGLFIRALLQGMDTFPVILPGVRESLNKIREEQGVEVLQQMLKEKDPEYYQQVDIHNPQRVIRALEVCLSSGQPYSSFRTGNKTPRNFTPIYIGLERTREELNQRIDLRMDEMLEKGLVEEVKRLLQYKDLNALKTVGYREVIDFLEGQYDEAEMIRLLKQNSRNYAKRQMTWFKKEDVVWFHPDQWEEILLLINERVK